VQANPEDFSIPRESVVALGAGGVGDGFRALAQLIAIDGGPFSWLLVEIQPYRVGHQCHLGRRRQAEETIGIRYEVVSDDQTLCDDAGQSSVEPRTVDDFRGGLLTWRSEKYRLRWLVGDERNEIRSVYFPPEP
jgi:hypothetical protein